MFCEKCREYIFTQPCQCKEFSVDHDGDIWKVYALDEEGAAESFARKYNENGDYNLMDSTEICIINGIRFEVSAEPDIHYSVQVVGIE